jgi:ankyrin repeat protein
MVNALLRKGRRGRDYASLAVVMGLRAKNKTDRGPGATMYPSVEELLTIKVLRREFNREGRARISRNNQHGLFRLNKSVLMVVLEMLSFSGKGADPNVGCGQVTPLWYATNGGYVGIVQALLKAGADVDSSSSVLSTTALMECSRKGLPDVVNELLKGGADPEKVDTESGRTALFYAVQGGNIDVVKALLEAGAHRAKVANDGTTPLLLAELFGHVGMVALLE